MISRLGVQVPPRADVHDLFGMRLYFEPFAAHRAPEQVHIDRPRELHEAASAADPQVARTASIDFHSEVVRLSGSWLLLLRSLGPLAGRMEWVFRLTGAARDRE